MMNSVEKSSEIAELFDYYKPLLTDKQREYFELYFFEDLTYQEVAEDFGVSRTAVHDSISKTITILKDLELKLGLKHKATIVKKHIESFKNKQISFEEFVGLLEGEL